jgi:hypothetical protein
MGGRQTKKRKLYPAIAIIGEGITESIYFTQMRQQEDLQFKVKPDLGKYSDIKSIVEKALDFLNNEYDIVFCVIDMDEMMKNKTLMNKYKKLKQEHGGDQLIFIENNPCMEFWFLLHYTFITKAFQNCKQLETLLKKQLPAYAKTQKFLAGNDIYNKLKSKQTGARNRAEKIPSENKNTSRSDVYKILDYLGIKKD